MKGLSIVLAALTMIGLACGVVNAPTPTETGKESPTPVAASTLPQDVTLNELFSNPDQYNGKDIILTGFYFDGWETTVLSEGLVIDDN